MAPEQADITEAIAKAVAEKARVAVQTMAVTIVKEHRLWYPRWADIS